MSTEQPRIPEKENVKQQDRTAGERGRHADKPTEVPKKGWLDVFWRTKQQLEEDNLSIVAAGVAFYAFVAVVPALAVGIAVYALVADASDLAGQLQLLARVVPAEVMPMLEEQVTRIATDNTSAGISAALGVLIALYSSANATKAIMSGLNIAYDETEKRGFVKLSLMAIGLTFGMIIGLILAFGLLAVLPGVLDNLGLSGGAEMFLNVIRWPILIGLFMLGVASVYRYGPCREKAEWKWVSPGAIMAAVLWVIGSALFSLYVSKFGSYDKTYGSLGAVVVFLMWLYLTAYVILLGAELNSEMERQTVKDTTTGPDKPMGERNAFAADTVGPSHEQVKTSEKRGETKKR
jgi:membrane protein